MKVFLSLIVLTVGMMVAVALFPYYNFMVDHAFIDRRSEDKTELTNTIGLQASNPNLFRNGAEVLLMFYLMEDIERDVKWFRINNAPPFEINDDFLLNKSVRLRQIFDTSGLYRLGAYLNSPVQEYASKWDSTNNRFYIHIRIGG